jgi:hypothetical protein
MKHIRIFETYESLSTKKQDFKYAIGQLLDSPEFKDLDPSEAEAIFNEFAQYAKADAYRKRKGIESSLAGFKK